MTSFETLQLERLGRVVRIRLNRPSQANGLNDVMARELAEAAASCDGDSGVKAVVLCGSGRFFSAGGDLKAMASRVSGQGQFVKSIADQVHRAISTFARMDAPLIVAVNGAAAGGGFSLAITGDLVLACESATFTMAYTKAGLSPDGSSSYYLPRLIGLRRSQELMLTNRTLTSREALEWGLVNYVVPDKELDDRAIELAAQFSLGARKSNAIVKKLLLATFSNGLEAQMEIEGRGIAECIESNDGQEGLKAFLQKRPPVFS